MVSYVKYDSKKAKKYNLKDDADYIERYLLKKVENEGILEAEIDIQPFERQMHIVVTLVYDPDYPGIDSFLESIEMYLMMRVKKVVVMKVPKVDEKEV